MPSDAPEYPKPTDKPPRPELPAYVLDALDSQPPQRLRTIATYAADLADWKQRKNEFETARQRAEEAIGEEAKDDLEERGVSTDPADYDDVPATGAYVTIKETKPGYRYYYWQWRDGETWQNEYIAPVEPKD